MKKERKKKKVFRTSKKKKIEKKKVKRHLGIHFYLLFRNPKKLQFINQQLKIQI